MIRPSRTLNRNVGYQPAFTLVEVLASLVLVAIILPVAMKGISLITGLAGSAKQHLEAGSLAETKLAELLATGAWQDGDSIGDFGQDWPDYRWTAEVRDREGTTLREVEVGVQWTRRATDRSITLTTLAYTGSR